LKLPKLQVKFHGASKYVTSSVHVERHCRSVGGLLTTTTLHPTFEALVHGVDPEAQKPEFCIGVGPDNGLRIFLGGDFVCPIQDLKELQVADLRTIEHTVSMHTICSKSK